MKIRGLKLFFTYWERSLLVSTSKHNCMDHQCIIVQQFLVQILQAKISKGGTENGQVLLVGTGVSTGNVKFYFDAGRFLLSYKY